MKLTHTALTLAAILAIAAPAFAEEARVEVKLGSTTTPPRVEIKKKIEAKKVEIKNKIAEIKDHNSSTTEDRKDARSSTTEAVKEKRQEVKQEIKDNRTQTQTERMKREVNTATRIITATADRLGLIADRITSRLLKLKTAGGNTTTAEASVTAAKVNLADVKVHVAAITALDLSGSTTTSTTTMKLTMDKMKTEAKAARESLTKARQNLEAALKVIREIEKAKIGETSTTTGAKIELH
ncbi:MAG: hypothetical protein JWN89_563 [Parcubacteria group bacterium]|nr:hypothetical protein [Parcubacteria group bacterium]